MNYGLKISLFLFTNSFLANYSTLYDYTKIELRRFVDRTYKVRQLKKDVDDPDDDEPNTRQRLQSELEALYRGDEFEAETAYSRMMSTLFVLLLFSAGMPILYLIGFIFFLLTFITNKIVILKSYTKSTTLTRTIPKYGQRILIGAVYCHVVMALFMYTNDSIFITKEDATDTVEVNLRGELEENVITPDEESGAYMFFRRRFTLVH